MYKSENEKTCVNDNHVIDYLANENNFKDIPKELLEEGKSVIDAHPQIANGQIYVIEPSGQVYLIRVEYQKNIKERELTADEYKIAGSIFSIR